MPSSARKKKRSDPAVHNNPRRGRAAPSPYRRRPKSDPRRGSGGRSFGRACRRSRSSRNGRPLRPEDDRDAGDQQRNRQQLTHRRSEHQVADLGVRFAEKFTRHAGNCVADEKQPGDDPGALPSAKALGSKEQQEEQDALAKGFVELARMTRHRSAVRKDHRPRNLGRPAEELSIDEICDPAKEEPDGDRLGDDVGEREERDFAGAGEPHDGDRHPERAAVERHAAMPDVKRLKRMKDIVAGFIEEDVTNAPAEDDAERRPYEEVVDVLASDEMWRPPG